ncbi:MAG: hypothetical protein M3R30_10305 [Candidatus Eremiobacteraeota bacterium]|nr:hypothetical protein [Candidatus Eremiobacteraeota bacterium]
MATPYWVRIVPVAISVLLFLICSRAASNAPPRSAAERRTISRAVAWATGAEGLAIVASVNVLVNVHLPDEIVPVIAVIVGLHFLYLAAKMPAQTYYVTGGLLVLAGLAGSALPMPERLQAVCASAAIVLWGTSLVVSGWRPLPDAQLTK